MINENLLILSSPSVSSDDLRVHCNSCRRLTKHGVVRVDVDDTDPENIKVSRIIRCRGCDEVSFEAISRMAIEDSMDYDETINIYPPRQLRPLRNFHANDIVYSIYRESVLAFNSGSLLLCAGGLRALVEGICADKGIADGPKRDYKNGGFKLTAQGTVERCNNLDCKIEGLAEKDLMTVNNARLLHELRFLGNAALHELQFPTKEALITAFDILENIMENLYNLPLMGQHLEKLRAPNT